MLPHLEAYLKNFDPREPLLQRWALDLIDIVADSFDPVVAEALESRLATPEFVGALFKTPHSRRVSRAFSTLSAERFGSVVDELETLWQVDVHEEHYHWSLARVLADVDPERAARLFAGTIKACAAPKADAQRLKLPQIAVAINKLPPAAAHDLAHAMIGAYEAFAQSTASDSLAPRFIFDLAWRFHHPKGIDFLRDFLSGLEIGGPRQGRWDLVHLAFELGDAAAEYHLGCDRIEKVATIGLADLAVFYQPDTDLAGFEAMMRQVSLRRYAGVSDLVAKCAPLLPDQRLAKLLTHLVEDQALIKGLHQKKQRPYFYTLILSLLLRSQRRETPDFSDLSLDAALDILAADPRVLPYKEALVTWLAGSDPAALMEPLRTRLLGSEAGRPAAAHIELAGRLKADTLVEALLAIPIGEHGDEDCDVAVEHALLTSGELYFDRIDRQWDQLNPDQLMRTLQIAAKALGQRARQCVETHFDHFWRLDREALLAACPMLGVDCRKQLEPFVNKNQPLVDQTWLLLSLLNGDHSDTVAALLYAHKASEEERQSWLDATLIPEAPLDAMPSHIDIDLTCSECGETFAYRLERIWLNPEEKGDYYPAQELQCLGCNHRADFSFSGQGLYTIGMHALELNMAASQSDFEALLEKSPFEILPRVVSYGPERRIGDAVDAWREEIFQQPEAPLPLFELGNIYVNIDHRIKARQCFENVIALAPDAIEAYLMLAQMAIDKEDYEDAREQLERGRAYLEQPRLLMADDVSRDPLVSFYRTFAERLAEPEPNLSDLFSVAEPPQLRKEKIGRNDPCPCGSGKKYKHCCLG